MWIKKFINWFINAIISLLYGLLSVLSGTWIWDSGDFDIQFIFPEQDHVRGINQIYINFSEQVERDDIQVCFFQEVDGSIEWEYFIQDIWFSPSDRSSITVPCPQYRLQEIDDPVVTYIEVRRLSDGAITSAKPFKFLPLITGFEIVDYYPKIHDGFNNVILAFNYIIDLSDIQVHFFKEVYGEIVCEEFLDINNRLSIMSPLLFATCPIYKPLEIDVPLRTYIQCIRPSDGVKSTPVTFTFPPPQTEGLLPLKRICRRVIRQSIGNEDVEKRVDSLKLPRQIKMYLLQR